MANQIFYYGHESLCEIGYQGESLDKTDVTTAVTPTESMAYIRECSIKVNENITHEKFLNGANGRNISTRLKGVHEAEATLKFNVAKDLDQTDAQEGYFLKMAIDGDVTDASNVYTIPPTTNEYGADYLKVFTLEAGYNKTSNVICHRLTGCLVNKETMHFEFGKIGEWTWNMLVAKHQMAKSFTAGSVSESTEKPFTWGDLAVSIGNAGGAVTAIDGIEMFEHIINNNATAEMDLANSSSVRYPTFFTLGIRQITGTMRVKLSTATDSGQDLWEILSGTTTDPTTPSETITLKDLKAYLYIDGTYYVQYTYHDVTFGQLDDGIPGKEVVKYTIPWTAKAVVLEMKMNASNTEPTNWA